jgi:hypothetical protein
MRRPVVLALLGAVFSACSGAPSPGGVAELAHYGVEAELVDHVDELHAAERDLTFNFQGGPISSPERCGSLVGATVVFNGMPVGSLKAGGWAVNRVPTNTAPGETINLDHCEMPFFQNVFVAFEGEPQNGTLEIEGQGHRFDMVIARPLGNPQITMVSATPEKVVVRVQDFPVSPSLRDFSVDFSPTGGTRSRLQLQEGPVAADGLLEAALPASASRGGALEGILSVTVQLGRQATECHGFASCNLATRLIRHLSVVVPRP